MDITDDYTVSIFFIFEQLLLSFLMIRLFFNSPAVCCGLFVIKQCLMMAFLL